MECLFSEKLKSVQPFHFLFTYFMINPLWFGKDQILTREELNEYKKKETIHLCTTRFNTETWEQNRLFCKTYQKGCFYSSPYCLKTSVGKNAWVFMLEMNNSQNKIMGIGCFMNILQHERYNVYTNSCYNHRYYDGIYRIDRTDLNAEELAFIKELDNLCFYGRGHLKRGLRLTLFPAIIMCICAKHKVNMIEIIRNMFEKRFLCKFL